MDATFQTALRPSSFEPWTPADDFAPPRAAYVLVIPALLACTGAVSWVMSNPQGMVVSGVVGSVVALFTLWDWVYREGPTRLSTLLGMSLLLGYAFGAMNTWITLPRGSLTLSEIYGFQQGVLSRGLGSVLMSAATLYCIGEMFEKPLFPRGFRFHFDDRTRTLIYLGSLAMLVGYVTHSLSFAGVNATGGHLSVFGASLRWAYPSFAPLSIAAFFTSRTRKDRFLSAGAAVIYLLMLSVLGRRFIIYTTVLILWVLPLVGYRLRGLSVRKVILLAALGAIMVISALTFMLLRIAGVSSETSATEQATVAQRVEIAHKMVQNGGAYALAAKTSQTNLQTRTFILAFYSNILDASSRMPPALGKDAAGMFQLVIPSVIDPGKNKFFAEEGLDDTTFGFSYGDQANSILTAGATDFGFVGALAYPLLLVLLYWLIYNLFAARVHASVRMIGSLAFIHMFLLTESTLTGYFVLLRDTILFCVLITIFLKLPSFRLHAGRVDL